MASVPVDADPTDLVPVQAENESEGGQEGDSLRKPFYLSCHGASLTHISCTRRCSLTHSIHEAIFVQFVKYSGRFWCCMFMCQASHGEW